jgi:hypothetical protein
MGRIRKEVRLEPEAPYTTLALCGSAGLDGA